MNSESNSVIAASYVRVMRDTEAQAAQLVASSSDVRTSFPHQPAHIIAVLEAAVAVVKTQDPVLKLKRRQVLADTIYAGARVMAVENARKPHQEQKLNEQDPLLKPLTSDFVASLSASLDLEEERKMRQQVREQKRRLRLLEQKKQ